MFEGDFDLITGTRSETGRRRAAFKFKVNIKTKSHTNLLVIESLFIIRFYLFNQQ